MTFFFFFFKQKTAYEIGVRLVGSEMCIRDSSNSLHKQIFDVLDNDGHTNPLLTPKQICKLLDLSYKKYHSYVSKTVWEWKYYCLSLIHISEPTRRTPISYAV